MTNTLSLFSTPVMLLAAWLVYEAVRLALRRRERGGTALRFAGWAIRPWAAWAALNGVFRLAWERGYNNRLTFPFFANLWREGPGGADAGPLFLRATVWAWGAVVLLIVLALVLIARGVAGRRGQVADTRTEPGWRTVALLLAVLFVLAIGLNLAVGCLPDGPGPMDGAPGSLLSCWHAHATMLYTVPVIKNAEHFLSNFVDLQPRLRRTIHGLSHPPGASLSIYWIGSVMGVRGEDIRSDRVRLRYALGLTSFGALNVLLIYGLGSALFASRRAGLAAALLWLSAPLVTAYATFAQDSLYAVFFVAALLGTWQAATRERVSYGWSLALGAVFACAVMLNYSWCLLTTIFAVFVLLTGLRRRWAWRRIAWRGVLPLGVMTVLAGTVLIVHRLDYLKMYRVSREYVGEWYRFEGLYQHLMALVGGQLDLFVLMGSVSLCAFLAGLRRAVRERPLSDRTVFLFTILGVYAIPILFGPNSLKMETARCWNWVAAVPMTFAAAALLRTPAPRLFLPGAVAVSTLTYAGMRLYLNFAP
jgi:hypothetical protein